MVLPILLALGWSEQLLAVEWQRVDLAAFRATPTDAASCCFVCEVKRGGSGMQGVWEQALRYVGNLKLSHCRRILVTDGARSYLYSKRGNTWADSPMGYFNVERLRMKHVAPKGTNAVATLMALTPMNMMRA
jgi:hypothetical protein